MPAPSVQPLGLAIHELAANAAVHGSPLAPRRLPGDRLETESDGIALVWREQGGMQQCDVPSKDLAMSCSVLEKQLGGRITREWRRTACCFWSNCRLSTALAAASNQPHDTRSPKSRVGRRTPRSLSEEERQLNTTGPTFAELGHPERQAVLERLAVTVERTARWAEEGAGITGLGNLELGRSEILHPDQSPMRGTECIIDRSLAAVGWPHHKGG